MFMKTYVLLSSEAGTNPPTGAVGRLVPSASHYTNVPIHASAATSRVLGTPTHAQLPTLRTLIGIGSGHRQLIAVTCIAEHA